MLEINQTCAVQTGCFAGDTAGWPVTITEGGSYRLTSNLIVPDKTTGAILVSTSSVSIDLNGFEIVRSDCVGATENCTPALGSGSGVARTTLSNRGISVKNGSITGMGLYGVFLGEHAEVTGLRVRWNRLDGINVSIGSSVSDNTAFRNGDEGIFAGFGSNISGNTAYLNGDIGIFADSGSTVSGNTAYANGGDGIFTGFGSSVQRNTLRSNGGFGLRLFFDAAYRDNVITGNTMGTVYGGVNMGSNSCDGTTTCP